MARTKQTARNSGRKTRAQGNDSIMRDPSSITGADDADGDLKMGIDPLTQKLPTAQLADAQDDAMADPANPEDVEAGEGEEDNDMSEAADLEILDQFEGSDGDDSEAGDDDNDDEEDSEEEDEEAGGAPLSPSSAPAPSIPASVLADTASNTTLHPQRPTPYLHDAGHLLVIDPNPLPADSVVTETQLAANARDATQSLLNTLLTTCPVRTSKKTATVEMTLPVPSFPLPREKRVPAPKAPTKWEQFAARKGISKSKRRAADGEDRAGDKVFDEATGEWVRKWGYKGKNKAGENDWIVEVDEKAEMRALQDGKAGGGDPRMAKRADRKERVKRNERLQRANERKNRKPGGQ